MSRSHVRCFADAPGPLQSRVEKCHGGCNGATQAALLKSRSAAISRLPSCVCLVIGGPKADATGIACSLSASSATPYTCWDLWPLAARWQSSLAGNLPCQRPVVCCRQVGQGLFSRGVARLGLASLGVAQSPWSAGPWSSGSLILVPSSSGPLVSRPSGLWLRLLEG